MKVATLLVLAAALQTQLPARDAAPTQVAGTAAITGQLLSDEDPTQPIRLAKVELSGSALRRQIMVISDSSGRFVFPGLPAGRYSLTVSKPGLMTTAHGAKRPGGAGVPIVVADGEQVPVTMRIARGAVISGIVRDPNGEPAAGVRMQVLAYGIDTTGARTLQNGTFSNSGNGLLMTDDRGVYRIYGLRPGEYYVQASPASSGVGGRAASAAEIEWAQRAVAPGSSPGAAPAPGQSMTLAPVYYPGTMDSSTAAAITVKAGEERSGVDFAFSFIPTAKVSGVIRGPDGSPPKLAQASLVRPDGVRLQLGSTLFIRPDAEGRFTVANVPPGQYVLAARGSMQDSTNPAPGPMAVASMPLWAMAEVSVSGQDISGLELTLAPGLTVSGKLVFDGANTAPADLTRVSVALLPKGPTTMGAPSVVAQTDGTFSIPGVGPGEYRLSANVPAGSAAASPWILKSAIVSNVDAIDVPFTVRADVGGAVITFTDRPTELTGSLLDTAGKPALEYFIVAFPVDRSFWVPGSRRVRSARPGNTGSFRIANLPPGEYYVCAMTDLEPNLLNTSAYLEPLVAASIKLTLTEGEKKVQDLKIAR
jgi:hypothetical protein